MNARFQAAALARTFEHTVTAWSPTAEAGEEPRWRAVPCALSRSAHTSAPAAPDVSGTLPEAAYRLTLFTRPEVWFALGDRVEITDRTGRLFRGRTSDSICYPSHCATVVEVREVLGEQGREAGRASDETEGEMA